MCATYCEKRIAWAAGNGGANCPGFVTEGCQEGCEAEVALFVNDVGCAAYAPQIECFGPADAWYCDSGSVFGNNCVAESLGGATPRGDCSTVCDTQAAAVNACYGG
jgi:hypothetical protein